MWICFAKHACSLFALISYTESVCTSGRKQTWLHHNSLRDHYKSSATLHFLSVQNLNSLRDHDKNSAFCLCNLPPQSQFANHWVNGNVLCKKKNWATRLQVTSSLLCLYSFSCSESRWRHLHAACLNCAAGCQFSHENSWSPPCKLVCSLSVAGRMTN